MKYNELIEAKYDLKNIDISVGLQLANLIKKDCKDFLSKAKGGLLYRGVDSDRDYFKQIIRTNRRPRDTDPKLHRLIVTTFKNAGFVANRNNSIFVSGTTQLDYYGDIYVMFPIGPIEFTWSPAVDDLTTKFDDEEDFVSKMTDLYSTKESIRIKLSQSEGYIELHKPTFIKWLKNNYTNKNLTKAIESKNEIMIAASAVYGIQGFFFFKHVKQYL